MGENRTLKIRFAGRLISLLGQQMYGGPVPAVAELVANAWDADAKKVEINIPDSLDENSEIIVKDFGYGMTFNELNDYYLNIGYERRKIRGERTAEKRLVMGRKGIGKLAGFGIAEDIILKSVKDENLVQFTLKYSTLINLDAIGNYEFNPEVDEPSNEPSGVTVIFKNLNLKRNISIESFRNSMARRFALGTDEMKVFVNGIALSKESLDFDFRIPQDGWQTENINGFGNINYWFGFLRETIKDAELRGISVFARKRVAQFTPFHFNLTGGFNGQLGLEYLTGQVKAETLDEKNDFIATDRQTVNWQFPTAQVLEKWGQVKLKALCKEWKRRKDQKNIDKFRHNYGEFYERIEHLQDQEKEDLLLALDKISTLERIEPNDFKIIASSMISGIERESVKKIIKRINSVKDEAAGELLNAIKEWDIISAVSTAEVVYGKLEIIKQFNNLLKERTKEKAPKGQIDMQTFIKEYPWILGPDYEQLSPADFDHERGVDNWIKEIILETNKEPAFKGNKENKRFDLICIKNDFLIVVLELMRPDKAADYDHASRLVRYVTRIKAGVDSKGSQERFKRMSVYGLLIADNIAKDPSLTGYFQTNRSYMDYVSWFGLFDVVSARYKDFFEILKNKAPEDPRIKGLISINVNQ